MRQSDIQKEDEAKSDFLSDLLLLLLGLIDKYKYFLLVLIIYAVPGVVGFYIFASNHGPPCNELDFLGTLLLNILFSPIACTVALDFENISWAWDIVLVVMLYYCIAYGFLILYHRHKQTKKRKQNTSLTGSVA